MQRFNSHPTHQLQRGSALIISLVLLTIITLAAIIGMQRSSLQLKMVANLQFHQALFTTAQNSLSHTKDRIIEAAEKGINRQALSAYVKAIQKQASKITGEEDEEDEEETLVTTDQLLQILVGDLPEPLPGIKKENIKFEGRRLEPYTPYQNSIPTPDQQHLLNKIKEESMGSFGIKVKVKDNNNNESSQEIGLGHNPGIEYGTKSWENGKEV